MEWKELHDFLKLSGVSATEWLHHYPKKHLGPVSLGLGISSKKDIKTGRKANALAEWSAIGWKQVSYPKIWGLVGSLGGGGVEPLTLLTRYGPDTRHKPA